MEEMGLKPAGWQRLEGVLPKLGAWRRGRTLALPVHRLGNTPWRRRSAYWTGMRAEIVFGKSRQPLICCTVRMKTRLPAGSSLNVSR